MANLTMIVWDFYIFPGLIIIRIFSVYLTSCRLGPSRMAKLDELKQTTKSKIMIYGFPNFKTPP